MFKRGQSATIVRVYKGRQQADAVKAMQKDAANLGKQGYYPVSQSWAQGQWGCGAFLVALALCFLVIGILVFIYMLLVKPEGTMTVTYALHQAPPVPVAHTPTPPTGPVWPMAPVAPPALADPKPDIPAQIAALAALRDQGAITAEEFEAKKTELLSRM